MPGTCVVTYKLRLSGLSSEDAKKLLGQEAAEKGVLSGVSGIRPELPLRVPPPDEQQRVAVGAKLSCKGVRDNQHSARWLVVGLAPWLRCVDAGPGSSVRFTAVTEAAAGEGAGGSSGSGSNGSAGRVVAVEVSVEASVPFQSNGAAGGSAPPQKRAAEAGATPPQQGPARHRKAASTATNTEEAEEADDKSASEGEGAEPAGEGAAGGQPLQRQRAGAGGGAGSGSGGAHQQSAVPVPGMGACAGTCVVKYAPTANRLPFEAIEQLLGQEAARRGVLAGWSGGSSSGPLELPALAPPSQERVATLRCEGGGANAARWKMVGLSNWLKQAGGKAGSLVRYRAVWETGASAVVAGSDGGSAAGRGSGGGAAGAAGSSGAGRGCIVAVEISVEAALPLGEPVQAQKRQREPEPAAAGPSQQKLVERGSADDDAATAAAGPAAAARSSGGACAADGAGQAGASARQTAQEDVPPQQQQQQAKRAKSPPQLGWQPINTGPPPAGAGAAAAILPWAAPVGEEAPGAKAAAVASTSAAAAAAPAATATAAAESAAAPADVRPCGVLGGEPDGDEPAAATAAGSEPGATAAAAAATAAAAAAVPADAHAALAPETGAGPAAPAAAPETRSATAAPAAAAAQAAPVPAQMPTLTPSAAAASAGALGGGAPAAQLLQALSRHYPKVWELLQVRSGQRNPGGGCHYRIYCAMTLWRSHRTPTHLTCLRGLALARHRRLWVGSMAASGELDGRPAASATTPTRQCCHWRCYSGSAAPTRAGSSRWVGSRLGTVEHSRWCGAVQWRVLRY